MNKIASKLADSVRQAKEQSSQAEEPKIQAATKTAKTPTTESSEANFPSNRVWPD